MPFSHVPVLLEEAMHYLAPERGGVFVDGTLGGGGHAEATLLRMPPSGRLIGIDRDEEALRAAGERLSPFSDRFTALHGNFFDMKSLLLSCGVDAVDGILLDLGVSSHQLDTPERGFSYNREAPLDMRMDRTSPLTAADVVNTYSRENLIRILRDYGEERFAPRIADRIVSVREQSPIVTTTQLAETVVRAMPGKARHEQQHPARRTFQAIRIEVNGELTGLQRAVEDACSLLRPGGRLVIITFHSLEDRIVKQCFKSFAQPCTCPRSAPVCICGKLPSARILTGKPVTCTPEEAVRNSRSTCAKLRAVEKLALPEIRV